jgi:hypothetical protein
VNVEAAPYGYRLMYKSSQAKVTWFTCTISKTWNRTIQNFSKRWYAIINSLYYSCN